MPAMSHQEQSWRMQAKSPHFCPQPRHRGGGRELAQRLVIRSSARFATMSTGLCVPRLPMNAKNILRCMKRRSNSKKLACLKKPSLSSSSKKAKSSRANEWSSNRPKCSLRDKSSQKKKHDTNKMRVSSKMQQLSRTWICLSILGSLHRPRMHS